MTVRKYVVNLSGVEGLGPWLCRPMGDGFSAGSSLTLAYMFDTAVQARDSMELVRQQVPTYRDASVFDVREVVSYVEGKIER